jgi:hypothetical protein
MVGMSQPPTTHYARPFHLASFGKNLMSHSSYCQKGRSNFKLSISYAQDFMRLYKLNGFFGLLFMNQYSHENNKMVSSLDIELLEFLKNFHQDKSLSSNTILILFADHGARFSELRKSIKGLLHERNPFFSIYLPELFRKKYPNEYFNLKQNTNKVVTPMDIFATLIHLLDLESSINTNAEQAFTKQQIQRQVSLFKKISSKRNCANAGIEPHWCACLKRTELVVNSYLTNLAQIFVKYLNEKILFNHLETCERLELDTVNRVYLLDSFINKNIEELKKINKSSFFEFLNLNLLKEPTIETEYQKYLFQITTLPNNAIYEFTITVEKNIKDNQSSLDLSKIELNEKLISRINAYGKSANCIFNTFPDLRKYCFCKNLL